MVSRHARTAGTTMKYWSSDQQRRGDEDGEPHPPIPPLAIAARIMSVIGVIVVRGDPWQRHAAAAALVVRRLGTIKQPPSRISPRCSASAMSTPGAVHDADRIGRAAAGAGWEHRRGGHRLHPGGQARQLARRDLRDGRAVRGQCVKPAGRAGHQDSENGLLWTINRSSRWRRPLAHVFVDIQPVLL